MNTHIYAGAGLWTSEEQNQHRGSGVYRLRLGDDHWERLAGGLPTGAAVRVIAVHPRDSRVIYAGTEHGAHRSTNGGDSWQALDLSNRSMEVWSLLFDPRLPDTMYAGTSPAALYRSDDAGDTWARLPSFRPPSRVRMPFPCRVTRLAADRSAPQELYAALEVDGVIRSLDGGESWEDVSHDLVRLADRPHLKSRILSDTHIEGMVDAHALCLSSELPGAVFLAVRMGLFRSVDRGATWEDIEIARFSPLTYTRDVRVSPHNARTFFACLSPAARSNSGSLYRSDDLGRTWQRVDHGIEARGTMMSVSLHPHDPDQIYCATRCGQIFGTQDEGRTWQEYSLPDGAQDIYTLACA